MIRPINININAAHPELPLVEATTFTGSPSSVFIRGVPKAVGNWSITAVAVAVTYPDNSTTSRAAVESAEGVWVATIPGTATSGRTAAGFRILADGIDENGAAVSGYVLGFADFSVFSFAPVPAPGDTFWMLRLFDSLPSVAKKGDVAKIDGVLKYYDGTAWQPFVAVVPPSTNPDDSGKAADAKATGDELALRPTKAQMDAGWLADKITSIPDGATNVVFGWDEGSPPAPIVAFDINGKHYVSYDYQISSDGLTITLECDAPEFPEEPTYTVTVVRYRVCAPVPTKTSDLTNDGAPNGGGAPFASTSYVDNQVATNTANFLGTYDYATDLGFTPPTTAADVSNDAIAAAMPSHVEGTPTNNDYVFVVINYTATTPADEFRRFKYNATDDEWLYEYTLNSASFTPAQWAAINSGITGVVAPSATATAGQAAGAAAVAAALVLKAEAARCRYLFSPANVSQSGSTVEVATADHKKSYATIDTTGKTLIITLAAPSDSYTRDMFLSLTINGTAPVAINIEGDSTQSAADIIFGEDSIADIKPGRNLILFTEVEPNAWLVSVMHKDAQA